MVRLIDPQFRIAQQQQRLAEKRLQLENDPGRIFMKSIAQTVPQELLRGGMQMAGDALGYYAFGGERDQMRKDAEMFKQARDPYFKKYHEDVYRKMMASRAPGVQQMPTQMPTQMPRQAAPKPQKQKRITLPDGRVAVEVERGGTTFYKGKYYNVIPGAPETSAQQTDQRSAQKTGQPSAPKTRMIGDGRMLVKVGEKIEAPDGDIEALQEKLKAQGIVLDKNGVPYRLLNQEQTARYTAQKRKSELPPAPGVKMRDLPRPEYFSGSPITTSGEDQAAAKLQSSDYQKELVTARQIAEKEFGEGQSNKRKRLDKITDQMSKLTAKAFEYMGVSSVGDLRKDQDFILNAMARSEDPDEIDIYLNAYESLPTENQLVETDNLIRSGSGADVGQVGSRKRGTTIRMPSSQSFQSAAEKAQIVVDKLRTTLSSLEEGSPQYRKTVGALRRAVGIRDSVISKSMGRSSSTGPVVTNENGDVLVSSETAGKYGGLGSAPIPGGAVAEVLRSGKQNAKPMVLRIRTAVSEGRATPALKAAYVDYQAKKPGSAENLAAFLDTKGNVIKDYLQEPEDTFEKTYPVLAADKEDFTGSSLLKEPAYLSELNSQLDGIGEYDISAVIQEVVNRKANQKKGETPKDVVKSALTTLNL